VQSARMKFRANEAMLAQVLPPAAAFYRLRVSRRCTTTSSHTSRARRTPLRILGAALAGQANNIGSVPPGVAGPSEIANDTLLRDHVVRRPRCTSRSCLHSHRCDTVVVAASRRRGRPHDTPEHVSRHQVPAESRVVMRPEQCGARSTVFWCSTDKNSVQNSADIADTCRFLLAKAAR
jgi:hypothetical protein